MYGMRIVVGLALISVGGGLVFAVPPGGVLLGAGSAAVVGGGTIVGTATPATVRVHGKCRGCGSAEVSSKIELTRSDADLGIFIAAFIYNRNNGCNSFYIIYYCRASP